MEECKVLLKNANHFSVCIDKFLSDIPNCKQLAIHFFIIRLLVARWSSFMGHGDAETGLEKLEETLVDFDYADKFTQASVDDQTINWELLEVADNRKDNNPLLPELLSSVQLRYSRGSWWLQY